MELFEFAWLTEEQRAELEGEEEDPWDGAGIGLEWRPKERHVGLRDDSGRLIANAGLLVAEVEVGGRRFPVVGLGGVIVNADHRGRGLSLRVVQAALERATGLGPEFMLLFCHENRSGLYRRFGFEEVGAEVLVEHDGGHVVMPMRTMWRALLSQARWPAGRVVLLGLPF